MAFLVPFECAQRWIAGLLAEDSERSHSAIRMIRAP